MYQKVHGFELADNGEIRKLRPEVVDHDPTDIAAAGRIWYNRVQRKLKFSDMHPETGELVTRLVLDEVEIENHKSGRAKTAEGVEVRLDDPVFEGITTGRVWLREDTGRFRFFVDNVGTVASLARLQDIVPEYNNWLSYHHKTDTAAASTTSTSLREKSALPLNGLVDGTYRIGWDFNYHFNSSSKDFISYVEIVELDGNREILRRIPLSYTRVEPKDSNTSQRIPSSGFGVVDLTDGDYEVKLFYCSSSNGKKATIFYTTLECWRVS